MFWVSPIYDDSYISYYTFFYDAKHCVLHELYIIFSNPLTINDLNLGGTNLSCLGEFGGPVMPGVALGGFTGMCKYYLV